MSTTSLSGFSSSSKLSSTEPLPPTPSPNTSLFSFYPDKRLWDKSESHMLSRKAKAKGWDTFLFVNDDVMSGNLVYGFNVGRHSQPTPLTKSRFMAWLELIRGDGASPIDISPCQINTLGVFEYFPGIIIGDPVSPSEEPFVPGNYFCIKGRDLAMHESFVPLKCGEYSFDHDDEKIPSFPPHTHGCFITASTENLRSIWITPPYLLAHWNNRSLRQLREYRGLEWLAAFDGPSRDEIAEHSVMENTVTLHKDLVMPWLQHEFSVDVDDNYRLVLLEDISCPKAATLLKNTVQASGARSFSPSSFPGVNTSSSETSRQTRDGYLRSHFQRSLRIHSLEGDIKEDYTERDFAKAYEEFTGNLPKFAPQEQESEMEKAKELLPLNIALESWYYHERLEGY